MHGYFIFQLSSYAAAGEAREAMRVLDEMRGGDVAADVYTFNLLVRCPRGSRRRRGTR
jgi:pentatricopeptide repeat protein